MKSLLSTEGAATSQPAAMGMSGEKATMTIQMPARTLRPDTQTTGNIGLYYVCYQLSRFGWNVMPTARNARGIDILIYSQDAVRKYSIQVKTLSKSDPVPLGTSLEKLYGEFFIVCRNVASDTPECFILTPTEVRLLAHKGSGKDGKISYWLQPKKYATAEFREKWIERIGTGLFILPPIDVSEPEGEAI